MTMPETPEDAPGARGGGGYRLEIVLRSNPAVGYPVKNREWIAELWAPDMKLMLPIDACSGMFADVALLGLARRLADIEHMATVVETLHMRKDSFLRYEERFPRLEPADQPAPPAVAAPSTDTEEKERKNCYQCGGPMPCFHECAGCHDTRSSIYGSMRDPVITDRDGNGLKRFYCKGCWEERYFDQASGGDE